MELLYGIATGLLVLIAYYLGNYAGQKIVKGENVELPDPIKAIKEHKEQKEQMVFTDEAKKRQAKENTIMHNIDAYDGSGIGQIDVE